MSGRPIAPCAGISIVAESTPPACSKVTEKGNSPTGRATAPAHSPSMLPRLAGSGSCA